MLEIMTGIATHFSQEWMRNLPERARAASGKTDIGEGFVLLNTASSL